MVDNQALSVGLMRQLEAKDEMIRRLLERVDELEGTVKEQAKTIEKLSDIISTYERKLYGSSSEKTHRDEKAKTELENEQKGDRGEESPQSASSETTDRKKNKPYTHPHKRDYSDIADENVIEFRPNAEKLKGARLICVTSGYRFIFVRLRP